MNINKAREFFSLYYENTLDPGLRQSFERDLKSDAQLQAEYRAFEMVMSELTVLRDADVEIPIDLHDRICRRIDLQLYHERRKAPSLIGGIWRSIALGGVAAAAIVGAIMAINRPGDGAITAGMIGSGNSIELAVRVEDATTYVLSGPRKATIRISENPNGALVKEFKLDGQRLKSPLKNAGPNPVLLMIEAFGPKDTLWIALPGTKRWTVAEGEGTIADLAKALAGYYQQPVEVQCDGLDQKAKWKFDGADPVDGVVATVNNATLSVEQRNSGVLCLIKH